jgi:O-antigen ligase
MGGAALVSRSRGGVVSLLAALLCMIGLGARGRVGIGRVSRIAIATALILLAGIWIGGDIFYGTIERLADEVGRPTESFRARLWADALSLWLGAPVAGTGLGSFGVVYPTVRTLKAPVAFTHAESDWVQLLTDTGLIGLGLALGTLVSLGLALLRRRRDAVSPQERALALAGLVALVGTAIQGIANFNLSIMSNLLYLAMAVAIALRKS